MRKLGVCVRYETDNYGSMLQLMALQKAIERIGWDYEFIAYSKKSLLFALKNIPRLFNRYFLQGKFVQIRKKWKLHKYSKIVPLNNARMTAFAEFRKRHFHKISPKYYGYAALKAGARNYDAVMVGSDQLWGPEGLGTGFYNLKFVPDDIRKISYSTSFGVKSIPWYQRNRTKKYLKRINYISVREQSGQAIVKNIAGKEVPVVLDPVMLFDKNEWKELVAESKSEYPSYILAYFLGTNPEHRKKVQELSKQTGLKIITLPHIDEVVEADFDFGDEQLYNTSPEEFLNLIRNAEYICTDSFHGTAFSILMNKQFTVFDRFSETAKHSRNSRIDTLCNLTGLEDRRYTGNLFDVYNSMIDYEGINKRLNQVRKDSKIFFEEALR